MHKVTYSLTRKNYCDAHGIVSNKNIIKNISLILSGIIGFTGILISDYQNIFSWIFLSGPFISMIFNSPIKRFFTMIFINKHPSLLGEHELQFDDEKVLIKSSTMEVSFSWNDVYKKYHLKGLFILIIKTKAIIIIPDTTFPEEIIDTMKEKLNIYLYPKSDPIFGQNIDDIIRK